MGRRWREKNGMGGVGMHMVSEGRVVSWNDIKGLENGAIVQVMENVQGGMGKRRKQKKDNNPWESDGGSEAKSSAEEQFDVIVKAVLMEEHRKELGNKYIDIMVEREVEDIKAKLWMVERRKEEQREEQRDREREEAEQREVYRKKEMEEAEREQGGCEKTNLQEQKGKREELEVLMDSRFRKVADRARLEREGDRIMEAEARHDEKAKELKEEKRVEDRWRNWRIGKDWKGKETKL